jgi:hypothetical protein
MVISLPYSSEGCVEADVGTGYLVTVKRDSCED